MNQAEDGTTYEVSQIMHSQALEMVGQYCTTSETQDTSVDQVSTADVSNFYVILCSLTVQASSWYIFEVISLWVLCCHNV